MSKIRTAIILNIALLLFIAVLAVINPIDNIRDYDITTAFDGNETFGIFGERSLEQEFICNANDNAFEICLRSANEKYHGFFDVSLLDSDGKILQEWHTDKFDISQDEWIEYRLSGLSMTPGNRYRLKIEASGLDEENAIEVYMSSDSAYGQKDIAYTVYRSIFNVFALCAVLVLFVCVNLCLLLKERGIEVFALPFLVSMGIIMILIMGPSSGMDENYHYYSAFKLSNIIMGRQNTNEVENRYRFIFDGKTNNNSNSLFLEVVKNIRYRTSGEAGSFEYDGRMDNLKQPLSHIAPAIGLTAGRLLHMNFIQIYTCARLCNLLLYIILVYTAIRMIPVNKELLLLLSSMPMAMHQAAQLSYDSMINGAMILFFAYILKCADEEEPFTWKKTACCTLMIGLVAPIKAVYVLLAFLVFIIPGERFKSKTDRMIKSMTVVFVTMVLLIPINGSRIVRTVVSTSNDVRFAQETYNIDFALQYPVRFIRLLLMSMQDTLWDHIKVTVGCMFSGDETLRSPEYLVIIYMIILLLCAVSEKKPAIKEWWQKLIVLSVSFMGVVAVYIVFIFSCTEYASFQVKGIHGRYFIPFLIPVMYCIGNRHIVSDIDRSKLLIPVCFLEAGYIISIMSLISLRS